MFAQNKIKEFKQMAAAQGIPPLPQNFGAYADIEKGIQELVDQFIKDMDEFMQKTGRGRFTPSEKNNGVTKFCAT